jgi:hypothetical protein
MVVEVVPWLARRGLISQVSRRRRRRRPPLRAASRPLLWLAAAGSVAFWVWQMQRRSRQPQLENGTRAATPASERGAHVQQPPPGGPPEPLPSGAAPRQKTNLAVVAPLWRLPAYLPDPARPWVYRAQQALHLGGPAELRRLAAEMRRAELDSESGLLDNYALLLERSSASRARVVAEVVRMLEAAADHRDAGPHTPQRPHVPMPAVPVESRRRATG